MKKTYLLSLLLLAAYCNSFAQTELTVGDKMPPLILNNILNSKTTSAKLQAKKNQLLLIDFWGTTCGTCIGSMPKMAALQKKWGDSINIILVSPEEKEKIEDLFRRRKEVKTIGLPIAYADKMLRKIFPYQSVPQIVVIDDQQRIRAITFHEYITEESLNRIRYNDTATLPLKRDIINVDYSVPFLKSDIFPEDEILNSTLFMKYKPGLSFSSGFRNESTKIVATNNTIFDLYEFAYKRQYMIPILEKKIRIIVDAGIDTTSRYCFEQISAPENDRNSTEEKALFKMKRSLDLFFGVTSSLEICETECWVIKPIVNIDSVLRGERQYNETFSSVELVNYNASALPSFIHAAVPVHIPIVYEGSNQQTITIKFKSKGETIQHMIEMLNEKGFSMKKEKREIKVIRLVKQ